MHMIKKDFNQKPSIRWSLGTAYDLFASLHVLHHPERFGLRPAWAAGVRSRLSVLQRSILEDSRPSGRNGRRYDRLRRCFLRGGGCGIGVGKRSFWCGTVWVGVSHTSRWGQRCWRNIQACPEIPGDWKINRKKQKKRAKKSSFRTGKVCFSYLKAKTFSDQEILPLMKDKAKIIES